MQDADRRWRVAYLLGRAHARRERQRAADIECEFADLQDQIAEAEAVELIEEDER